MKKFIALLFITIPMLCRAQETGVKFIDSLNWEQIKAKARAENKYIFVDCYATWCGPCKQMDKNVYSIDSVGKLINRSFIAIKVQLDSTAKDNGHVKIWYADARHLQKEYKVSAMPTLLFFAPDGRLVHKCIGYQNPKSFNYAARNALDPDKQYYTLLAAFQSGILSYSDMPYLVNTALSLGDQSLAIEAGKKYIDGYLMHASEGELFSPVKLRFLSTFTLSSADRGFRLFYDHAVRVDSIMNEKHFSQHLVDAIIEREEINPQLYKNNKPIASTPNWKAIKNQITKRYDDAYAERTVLWARIKWEAAKNDWPDYSKDVILKVEKYGPYLSIFPNANFPLPYAYNATAWDIFNHSNDPKDLSKALEWSKIAIADPKADASYFDTYANLLHKLGRTKEALSCEEKANTMDPSDKDLAANLEKMKKGEPTWPKLPHAN